LAGFAYTTPFCLGIAVLLYVLEVTDPFAEMLIVSLSIGWSIRTSLVVLDPIVGSWLPAYVTAVVLTAADLKLLQAQIEPHFLFNTLSNVVGLIRVDPVAAEKTLLNLTTLLRSSLNRTRHASVTLGEEMAIVRIP
jgi:hypothetical protein